MDPLTATMTFLRAAVAVNLRRMEDCAAAYPALIHICGGASPTLQGTVQLERVRDHAVQLARDSLTADFQAMQEDTEDPNCPERRHQKEQLLTRLKKLLPGATTALKAVRAADGQVTLDPQAMAAALAAY